ncbi:MAG: hypothetical protein JO284_02755, partial [Planctomycetaceae bacterium]|nr:hypothetical protein [Planctomycetaceae bacterium]
MFKKVLQVAATFGLLLAGYLGYVRGFALVAARVSRDLGGESVPFAVNSSKSKKETTALAVRAFGRDHWTTDEENTIRYYNSDRGYWMYAKSYERLKDGKQLKFEPFALISWSRDRRSLKTITSDKSVIDLDRPLGLDNKSDTPIHVIHAMIEGNVRLRDDKATRIPDDDLVIGPMAYIEYDEADLEIRSDREVVIQDVDMRVTGTGFLIKLRPKNETDPGTGFPGAKTAYLRRDVHIMMNDVGRSGILPGTARPEQAQGDKTPLDLRCVGQMQVDLPRERRYPPTFVGPPQPPGATLATFTRDVVVLRGKLHQMPDQLNCDDLRLILIKAEKVKAEKAAVRAGPSAEPGKDDLLAAAPDLSQEEDAGGGSALTLRRAEATGHAVWLQSKSDGLTVRCNELIHKKLAPEQPDETYFRGDATTRLQVEKLELIKDGPDKGKVQSVTTIRTTDAAIFDDGQNKNDATVVARGPGVLEIRPARDRPVERKATWDDQLILQTEEVAGRAVQKKITLTRNPKLVDLTRGTLDARAKIVIWLKPKPRPAVAATAPGSGNTATASSSAAESYEIDMLRAWERVHLAAPNRTMDARDLLEVKFESPTTVAAANPGPAPKPGGGPAPTAPDAAGAEASASTPTPATAPDPLAATQQEVAEKPATDPDVFVKANRVWAKIRLHPDEGAAASPSPASPDAIAGSKSEIEMVMLRGGVDFHQDPEPGKQRGIDVLGDALDVIGQGQGRSKFTVYQRDPYAPRPAPGPSRPLPPARVATEEFTATGEKIGLDQLINQAWIDGPGTLTQMAKRGLLTDQGLDEPAGRDRVDPKAPPEPTTPMT